MLLMGRDFQEKILILTVQHHRIDIFPDKHIFKNVIVLLAMQKLIDINQRLDQILRGHSYLSAGYSELRVKYSERHLVLKSDQKNDEDDEDDDLFKNTFFTLEVDFWCDENFEKCFIVAYNEERSELD